MIEIAHNFDPKKFMWLWAKYVTGCNDKYHCTNSIKGPYSKKFNRSSPLIIAAPSIVFDEQPSDTFRAVYLCGVARKGYSQRQNYPHNVHAAILPLMGATDQWSFENWHMTVQNGRLLPIPASSEELPERYRSFPDEYTTCRIFRWAVTFLGDQHLC